MTAKLPIYNRTGGVFVDVNGSGRIDVYDGASTYEILNSPDATPALGGKFQVFDASAPPPYDSTGYLCNYIQDSTGSELGNGASVSGSRVHVPRGGLVYGRGA